jgi:hypothetical protein
MELIFNVAVHLYFGSFWNHQTMMFLNTQIALTRIQNTIWSLSHCENIHEWIESSWMDNYGILLLLLPHSSFLIWWVLFLAVAKWFWACDRFILFSYWLKLAPKPKNKRTITTLSLGSTLSSHPPKCLKCAQIPTKIIQS